MFETTASTETLNGTSLGVTHCLGAKRKLNPSQSFSKRKHFTGSLHKQSRISHINASIPSPILGDALGSPLRCCFSASSLFTANLQIRILDFGGFDSSRIFILRVGILMSIGNFPENIESTNLNRGQSQKRDLGGTHRRPPRSAARPLPFSSLRARASRGAAAVCGRRGSATHRPPTRPRSRMPRGRRRLRGPGSPQRAVRRGWSSLAASLARPPRLRPRARPLRGGGGGGAPRSTPARPPISVVSRTRICARRRTRPPARLLVAHARVLCLLSVRCAYTVCICHAFNIHCIALTPQRVENKDSWSL